jgi:hypothetical protein
VALLWQVHAPTLGDSPLGSRLRARSEPPILDGENLLFWSGDPATVETLRRSVVCSGAPGPFVITP